MVGNTRIFPLLPILLAAAAAACSSSGGPQDTPSADEAGRFVAPAGVDLRYPTRLAVAPDGVVYVSDVRAGRVLGLSGGRVVTAIEGIPGALGLAVAGEILYVGSRGRASVDVYDLTARAFVRALGAGELVVPNAIAVAPDGTVYVVDSARDAVQVFDADGDPVGRIGGTGTDDGRFRFPVAVAVDAREVVVADQGNHRVQVFDREGGFLRAFGAEIPATIDTTEGYSGGLTRAQGLALDPFRVYVLDSYHSHVQVFDRAGAPLGVLGRRGRCPTCTGLALDVALTPSGHLLLSDPDHQRLVTLSPSLEVVP